MSLVAIVVILALVEFMVFGSLVGRARGKYKVSAPATTGHEVFERHFRVHQNTLEQLVIFIPSIWLFGMYVSTVWGAALGAVFILGRAVYAAGYVNNPSKREVGFFISTIPVLALFIGALIGAILSLIRTGI
jgi:uncharacterized membrane protein YecN with MAPEG domain